MNYKKFGWKYFQQKDKQIEIDNTQEASKDYPLGGMIEPYDIETEKELCEI